MNAPVHAPIAPGVPGAALPPLPPPVGSGRPAPPPPSAPLRSSPTTILGSGAASGGSSSGFVGIGVFIGLSVIVGIGVLAYMAGNLLGGLTVVNNLETGDCVADFFPSDENGYGEVLFVNSIGCEEPHALEVYAVSESLFFEDDYPGVDEAFVAGDEFCLREFDFFTGEPYEVSPYEMWVFVPIPESWAAGDRKVQCLIGSYDEVTLVEGTLRGSAVRLDT